MTQINKHKFSQQQAAPSTFSECFHRVDIVYEKKHVGS